jgi:hypothetical protein
MIATFDDMNYASASPRRIDRSAKEGSSMFASAKRTCRYVVLGLLCSIASSLSGCWLSSDDESGVEASSTKIATLSIDVSSTTASRGKPINFTVASKTQGVSIKSLDWTFSDGQAKSGEAVSASFGTAGRVNVTVTATLDDGTTASSTASVFILDGTGVNDPSLHLPAVIGDVDGDASISIVDALATAQNIYGTVRLPAERLQASDIDLDGKTTSSDLDLMMQAVLREKRFASAILTPQIYPGSVVAMISPRLFDPDSKLEVKVNGQPGLSVLRVAMGYATTTIPTTLAASEATATIQLFVDGELAETYSQPLLHVASMPANSAADVSQFIDELKSLLSVQRASITQLLNSSGTPAASQAAALASAQAGTVLLDKAASDLTTLFATKDGAQMALLFQKALYANGLQEYRNNLSASALAVGDTGRVRALALSGDTGRVRALALSGDTVCDTLIPAVCNLETAADLADKGSKVVSGACSVAAIAGFLGTLFEAPPVAAGTVAFFVDVCVPLQVAATFGSVVGNLFKPLEVKLNSAAIPGPQGPDQIWTVSSNVTFGGLQETCGAVGAAGTQALVEKYLGGRIVAGVMRSNTGLKFLADVFAKYSDKVYVALLEKIQSSVSPLLDATGLTDAFGQVLASVCPNLNAGNSTVPVRKVFTTQPAQDQGVLQYNANDTGTYFCPPAGPVFQTNVTLRGQLKLCKSEPAQTSVDVSCATNSVTITMGDNGTALDDIFEIVVDGKTVLTSSSPVRSTSTTIFLPKGRMTIVMRGLAAPDGIGTYFITFSGAALVSGQTSGTDLVPGTSKQFVVEVL